MDTERSDVSTAANPRVQFYQLLPQLIRAGKLTTEGANQLANLAKREGYPVALATAQQFADSAAQDNPQNSSLASCPQGSAKLPTAALCAAAAADLLYPKNELDAFFPRE